MVAWVCLALSYSLLSGGGSIVDQLIILGRSSADLVGNGSSGDDAESLQSTSEGWSSCVEQHAQPA